MRPILYTIVGILLDYLLILLIASATTSIMYILNPAVNVTSNILFYAILVIIVDAFRARVMEEYHAAKSYLGES